MKPFCGEEIEEYEGYNTDEYKFDAELRGDGGARTQKAFGARSFPDILRELRLSATQKRGDQLISWIIAERIADCQAVFPRKRLLTIPLLSDIIVLYEYRMNTVYFFSTLSRGRTS